MTPSSGTVISPEQHSKIAPLIVATFILFSSIYSIVTPIFEAPDEWPHYLLVKNLADGNDLPVQKPEVKTPWEQEGSQPPLYYVLMALLIRSIDTRDMGEPPYRNPHVVIGDASAYANRNLIIHTSAEDFPWRGTALAVHLLRFVSVGMGALTLALGYATARRIFPERRSLAIGTMSLVAFNPMFVFISGTVSNDNPNNLFSALAIYLLTLCMTETDARVDRRGWLRRAGLGSVAGLAALTKVSGLTLLPVIALGLSIRHLRRRDWRGWFRSGMLIAAPVLVIAGWWYGRNLMLYGEWLGIQRMVEVAGPRIPAATPLQLLDEFEGFRFSYWAVLGIFNILTFPAAYAIFDAFTLVSLVGWLVFMFRAWRRGTRECVIVVGVLAVFSLVVFLGVISWTTITMASQGRLMFPAIGPIALLMWTGWETLWYAAARLRWARWSMPVFLAALTPIILFRDIVPTYAGPAYLSPDQLPPDLVALDVDYGDNLRLLGYRIPSRASASDAVEFTLYWHCLTRPPADYSVYAILYGRAWADVGKVDAYPNRGLYATRECGAGTIFADPYRIALRPDAARPSLLRVQVGLRDFEQNSNLPASVGTLVFPVGKLAPPETTTGPRYPVDWRFGDTIALRGFSLPAEARTGDRITLSLVWHSLLTPPEAYTVFVHFLNERGKLVGQADGQPVDGDYPTDWWSTGEVIVDEHDVTLLPDVPGGDYHFAIGLYRLADGARLPVADASGSLQPDGRLLLRPLIRVRD